MLLGRKRLLPHPAHHFVWAGIVFVFFYWLVESLAHQYFFDESSFIEACFLPDNHELWMRIIVISLLVMFSFYSHKIVNQLKRAKSVILERERETQRILENNPAAIILVDSSSRDVVYANNNALNLIGTTMELMLGQRCHEFLCKSEQGSCPILDMGHPLDISERELITVEKKVIPVLKSATAIHYKGRPHLLEAFFDITRQKEMQIALQQTHAEMDQIFQTASTGMRIIDNNYNILKVNDAFSALSGVSREDAVGKKCYEVFSGSKCQTSDCSLRCLIDGRKLAEYEVSKFRADGSPLICNLTVTPFEKSDGTKGVVEAFKDISELKRIQNAIRSERDLLHRILFHQFENIGIINEQYLLEYQNQLLKKMTQGTKRCHCYEIFRDKTLPCDECFMLKAVASEKIQRFEFDTNAGKSFEHTYTPFVDNNGQHKVLVSRRDITEKRTSQAAVISAERMAALGELAAGVAHEINNPINGIINYGQILANRAQPGSDIQELSQRIINEGDRIAAIVMSLLSFARRDTETCKPVNIKALLDELLYLTAVQLKKDGITLSVTMADNLQPVVFAIGHEIQQVFLNIINNSRYALNEKYKESNKRKRLEIDIQLDETNRATVVRTSFTDYGIGMTPQSLDMAKNPFFTTKPKGKGTGLGLAISNKIVEKHGGCLSIHSIAGEYTKVIVELAACKPDQAKIALHFPANHGSIPVDTVFQ